MDLPTFSSWSTWGEIKKTWSATIGGCVTERRAFATASVVGALAMDEDKKVQEATAVLGISMPFS